MVLLGSKLTAATNSTDRCFPDSFLFGSATSAYQIEGGWNETGRTPSICDDFCRETPIQCANVADDFLHRYRDDIKLMADTGLSSFRFSISWSRVMNWDANTKRMQRNQPGIDFYHSVLDELTKHGIAPILTLYHSDLPRELHAELSPPGWLNAEIKHHFAEYSTLMFTEFGSKVRFWSTFNEPNMFATYGYGNGLAAPGMRNSSTNVYTAGHNVLLSHALAVAKFRALKKTNAIRRDARIGIVIASENMYPLDANDKADVAAAERKMQFNLGWFLQPIVSGEYPVVMRERAGDRLPTFTAKQSALLTGSYDLFMLNYYSSHMTTDCSSSRSTVACKKLNLGWERDMGVDDTVLPPGARRSGKNRDGGYNCPWLGAFPQGYLDNIKWMHKFDPKADILLTENGFCGDEEIESEDQLWYFQTHLEKVLEAIVEAKIPVIGYTAWSFMDNYEWGSYNPRFGLFHVNFTAQTGTEEGYVPQPTDLTRTPRLAARWYSNVAKTKCLGSTTDHESATMVQSLARTLSEDGNIMSWFVALTAVAVIVFVFLKRQATPSRVFSEQSPLLRN